MEYCSKTTEGSSHDTSKAADGPRAHTNEWWRQRCYQLLTCVLITVLTAYRGLFWWLQHWECCAWKPCTTLTALPPHLPCSRSDPLRWSCVSKSRLASFCCSKPFSRRRSSIPPTLRDGQLIKAGSVTWSGTGRSFLQTGRNRIRDSTRLLTPVMITAAASRLAPCPHSVRKKRIKMPMKITMIWAWSPPLSFL